MKLRTRYQNLVAQWQLPVFNTKFLEFENKIPDTSGLVKKTDYDAKISDIQVKYFTISDYNKFTSKILETKSKLKRIVFLIL